MLINKIGSLKFVISVQLFSRYDSHALSTDFK